MPADFALLDDPGGGAHSGDIGGQIVDHGRARADDGPLADCGARDEP